jgi:hypothetical protein
MKARMTVAVTGSRRGGGAVAENRVRAAAAGAQDRKNGVTECAASLQHFGMGRMSCHTPFRDSGNEASIRVPRIFNSHV